MAGPSLIAKSKIEYAKPAPQIGKGLGILVFIAFLFLAVVSLIYGGIFFYKRSLNESLVSFTRELAQLEEQLDSQIIEEMSRVDRGLATARTLLSRHIYTSQMFTILEDNTLEDVYYTNFTYDFLNGRSSKMEGVAEDYVTLHRQLERFRSLPAVSRVLFDTIQVVEEDKVGFTVTVEFNENTFRFR